MDKIIFFDYCAIIVYLTIFLSFWVRKSRPTVPGKFFLLMTILSFFTTIFDILSVNQNIGFYGFYISNMGYLLIRNFSAYTYFMYLLSLTDTWHIIMKKKVYSVIIIFPISVSVLLLLTNPFHNLVFKITRDCIYTREPLMTVLYVISFGYLVSGLIYLFVYRKLFKIEQLMACSCLFFMTVGSIVIQIFLPNYLVEMFASSISLLFISITIEHPEQIIDNNTGFKNFLKFTQDIHNAYLVKKDVKIIVIKYLNVGNLKKAFSHAQVNKILKHSSGLAFSIVKKYRLIFSEYALENGSVAFVFDPCDMKALRELCVELKVELNKDIVIDDIEINMPTNICLLDFLSDFDALNKFFIFLEQYTTRTKFDNEILDFTNEKFKDVLIFNSIEEILGRAITNDSFEVYYQPIYSLKEKRFDSCEALIRLNDEKYGYISPNIFIPLAEKAGLINKIGDIVFEKVCKFISSPDFEKLGIDYIETNLSATQCMQPHLYQKFIDIMEKYKVKPSQINLEITETATSYDQNVMFENVNKLREYGVSFSLDDFGIGYSNIARISALPIKIVKIDKSFVDQIEKENIKVIIEDTIKMIKHLNLKIVVEGIETKEKIDFFDDLDCEFIQGYFYSKPLNMEEFKKFITTNN